MVKSGYHITPPMGVLYDLRGHMCMILENVAIKYHHHSGGPGQMETRWNWRLREMADKPCW